LGGLGHMGVKIARAMGADVTVFSHSLNKEADGKRMGAAYLYVTSGTLDKVAGSFGLIICTVPIEIEWNRYLGLLKRDGTMVIVGIPEKTVPIGAPQLIFGRRNLAGSAVGGIKETQEMLDFCGEHSITAEIELISIQQVNGAYEQVINSDVRYRFVIDIESIEATSYSSRRGPCRRMSCSVHATDNPSVVGHFSPNRPRPRKVSNGGPARARWLVSTCVSNVMPLLEVVRHW
jgi:alcohol dehydrogenase (NADP+)